MASSEKLGVSPNVQSSHLPLHYKQGSSHQSGWRVGNPSGSWWTKICLTSPFPTCPDMCRPGFVTSKDLLQQKNSDVWDNTVWPWMKMNFLGCRSCHSLTKTSSAWLGPDIPASTLGKGYGGQHHSGLPSSNLPQLWAAWFFPARALHSWDILMSIVRWKLALDFTSLVRLTQMYSCGKNNNGKAAWEMISAFCCCLAFWCMLSVFWMQAHVMHCNAIAIQTGLQWFLGTTAWILPFQNLLF